jgi:hypothetical protein
MHDRPGIVAGIDVSTLLALEDLPGTGVETVYVSGSCVDGTGNAWSDVDVFVIGARTPAGFYARDGGVNQVVQHFVGDRRIDFEYWTEDSVSALAARLDAVCPGSGESLTRTTFSYIEECFIHRLRIGVAAAHADRHRAICERFDFQRLAAYQCAEVIRQLDAHLDDLLGMMESGDHDSALFTARDVVGLAVDAYLHGGGDTNPVSKWRVKRLDRRADGDPEAREIQAEFWRLQFPNAGRVRTGADARERHLSACVRFANRIVTPLQQ